MFISVSFTPPLVGHSQMEVIYNYTSISLFNTYLHCMEWISPMEHFPDTIQFRCWQVAQDASLVTPWPEARGLRTAWQDSCQEARGLRRTWCSVRPLTSGHRGNERCRKGRITGLLSREADRLRHFNRLLSKGDIWFSVSF